MDRRGFLRIGGVAAAGATALGLTRPAHAFEAESELYRLTVTPLAQGLDHPWGMAFLPGGEMLVSERAGRLRILRGGVLDPTPLAGVPAVLAQGQGGLLDLALHPKFASNRLLYFTYAAGSATANHLVLARATLGPSGLQNVQTLLQSSPDGRNANHYGGRIAFDYRGYLYLTIGDRKEMDRAQRKEELNGKIVRLFDDGRVPPDNPFVGRAGWRPEIWALGVRSPQGLCRQPKTGRIYECEHGPKGGDEINWVRKGRNYGWPIITHGVDYDGSYIGPPSKPGLEQPVTFWTPSIAPSGISFYNGKLFPAWSGHLFVAALKYQMLVRLVLDPAGTKVVREERMLEGALGRLRHVLPGPDGRLYLLTDADDGGVWAVGRAMT